MAYTYSLLLVRQSSNLTFPTPCRTRIWHLAQINDHVEGIMGSISLGNPWHHSLDLTFDDLKEAFLAKEWKYFHLTEKKQDYLHLKDFLKYECELYLKQSMTPSQYKYIVAYRIPNHRLAIEIRQWSTIPIFIDNSLFHFCSYNAVEIEAHFVLEYPLYNSIEDKFQSLFKNVVLGSLKSLLQLDHKVHINLYLMEAIHTPPL